MALSPLDIKKKTFRRALRGCDENDVAAFLELVAAEYESLLGVQRDTQQRAADLERQLAQYALLEKNIQQALVQAQDAAAKTVESARREAEVKLREAELAAARQKEDARREAERIIASFQTEAARLADDITSLRAARTTMIARIKTFLASQSQLIASLEADENAGREQAPPDFLHAPIDEILKNLE